MEQWNQPQYNVCARYDAGHALLAADPIHGIPEEFSQPDDAAGWPGARDGRRDRQERRQHQQRGLCGRAVVSPNQDLDYDGFDACPAGIPWHSTPAAGWRVLVSGMGADFGEVPDQRNAEFYSPPYLFKGPRPTIMQAPAQISYELRGYDS